MPWPALFQRTTVGEPHEENPDLETEESESPQMQLEIEKQILRFNDPILIVQLAEQPGQPAVFRYVMPQLLKGSRSVVVIAGAG